MRRRSVSELASQADQERGTGLNMKEYTAKIIGLGYTPPRMVTVRFEIEEDGLMSTIDVPLEQLNIEEITQRLQAEVPKLVSDPGREQFKEAAGYLIQREIKINVKNIEDQSVV